MNINWRTIHIPRPVRRVLLVLAVFAAIRLLIPDDRPKRMETVRTEKVNAVDWTAVNQEVRGVFVQEGGKAETHARQAVREWTAELRKRAETDFIPWYFGYFNQQAMALRAAGHFLMDTTAAECLTGPQDDARSKMERYIADAFMSRVLQPGSGTTAPVRTKYWLEGWAQSAEELMELIRTVGLDPGKYRAEECKYGQGVFPICAEFGDAVQWFEPTKKIQAAAA
jgi:hypothetical protein